MSIIDIMSVLEKLSVTPHHGKKIGIFFYSFQYKSLDTGKVIKNFTKKNKIQKFFHLKFEDEAYYYSNYQL